MTAITISFPFVSPTSPVILISLVSEFRPAPIPAPFPLALILIKPVFEILIFVASDTVSVAPEPIPAPFSVPSTLRFPAYPK